MKALTLKSLALSIPFLGYLTSASAFEFPYKEYTLACSSGSDSLKVITDGSPFFGKIILNGTSVTDGTNSKFDPETKMTTLSRDGVYSISFASEDFERESIKTVQIGGTSVIMGCHGSSQWRLK